MNNHEQEYHEMVLETVHASGAEEWFCPSCGRRFLMQWPPAYSKVILEPGDETAIHSGGKGGVSISHTELQTEDQSSEDQADWQSDPNLQPWIDWCEQVDFEAWWNKES